MKNERLRNGVAQAMQELGLALRAFNVFLGDRNADKEGSLMSSDSSFEVDRRV